MANINKNSSNWLKQDSICPVVNSLRHLLDYRLKCNFVTGLDLIGWAENGNVWFFLQFYWKVLKAVIFLLPVILVRKNMGMAFLHKKLEFWCNQKIVKNNSFFVSANLRQLHLSRVKKIQQSKKILFVFPLKIWLQTSVFMY